jgi:hypothetical protein
MDFFAVFYPNLWSMKNLVFLMLLSLCIIPACKKSALPVAAGNTLNKTVVTISETSFLAVDSFVLLSPNTFSYAYYSNGQPMVQTAEVVLSPSVTATQATECFYQ